MTFEYTGDTESTDMHTFKGIMSPDIITTKPRNLVSFCLLPFHFVLLMHSSLHLCMIENFFVRLTQHPGGSLMLAGCQADFPFFLFTPSEFLCVVLISILWILGHKMTILEQKSRYFAGLIGKK